MAPKRLGYRSYIGTRSRCSPALFVCDFYLLPKTVSQTTTTRHMLPHQLSPFVFLQLQPGVNLVRVFGIRINSSSVVLCAGRRRRRRRHCVVAPRVVHLFLRVRTRVAGCLQARIPFTVHTFRSGLRNCGTSSLRSEQTSAHARATSNAPTPTHKVRAHR